MKHFASPDFWHHYRNLPERIQRIADKNFALLKEDSRHPSLRLKKGVVFWSDRIGITYRAIAKEQSDKIVWIWIGHHDEYDEILKTQ